MSPENLDALDHQRQRWHRARIPLHLVDTDADDFSTGGLASRVNRATVRLLLLPAEPDAWLLDFDSAFWAWWSQDREDPSTGEPTRWGTQRLPTENAALRTVLVEEGRLARIWHCIETAAWSLSWAKTARSRTQASACTCSG